MHQQMGLAEFFAMEASEYLERLDALVSPAASPNPDELVGLARQLRGSALMAKQTPIAAAAAAFEKFARAVQDSRRPWDEATRQLAVRAVDDFKILVRQVPEWTDAETQKAQALAAELDPEGGGAAPTAPPAPAAEAPDSGTRAFVGREGASVASALDQAAKALQQDPGTREPLGRVLAMMQPLRGLALLADLPPMPDLLDGVERAIAEIVRRKGPAADAALLFNSAAQALSRASREIATDGRADADAPETLDFAQRLGGLFDLEADVLPIDSLYHEDEGPHVVERGTAAARPAELARVELVSHGEHLRQAADGLERAQSAAQRELRAQALAATFRKLGAAAGDPLQEAVAHLAAAARRAVAAEVAAQQTEGFVALLREAGAALSTVATAGEQEAVQRLEAVAAALDVLAGPLQPAAPQVAMEAPPAPPPAAPVFTPQPTPTPTAATPVQAPAAPPAAPPPQAPAAPPPAPAAAPPPQAPAAAPPAPAAAPARAAASSRQMDEPENLLGSWLRYQRYVEVLGLGAPSLDQFLAGPPADPTAPGRAVAAAPVAAPEAGIVPITDLCYSGTAALKRAASLKAQIRAGLAAGRSDTDLRDLIEEALDLVELGLQQ